MLIEVVTMHVRLKYIFHDVMISYQIIAYVHFAHYSGVISYDLAEPMYKNNISTAFLFQ